MLRYCVLDCVRSFGPHWKGVQVDAELSSKSRSNRVKLYIPSLRIDSVASCTTLAFADIG